MSEYYERNNRNPQACSFAGNGTVNSNPSDTAFTATSAASSCISSSEATFTPTAPTGSPNSGSSSGGDGNDSGRVNNGAAALINIQPLSGVVIMAMISILGGIWSFSKFMDLYFW